MVALQVKVDALGPKCPDDNVAQFKRTLIRHLQARGCGEMPPASVWSPEHDDVDDDIVEI